MTRKFNIVLLALLLLIGFPFYWLLLDTSTRDDAAKPVTIFQLRALAQSLPGTSPSEVRYERIGRRTVTSDLIAAGSGLRPSLYVIRAFELVLPGGEAITIDRGMSRAIAQTSSIWDFDPAAQAAVDRATTGARLALVLDPRPLHSGGASVPPEFGSGRAGKSGGGAMAPYAVAPGVVVIPAYGISPGARMIYARLADGQELLFAGDVAPVNFAWVQQRPPARVMTRFVRPRDREEIAAWLRTIRALKRETPGLEVVTGHDRYLPPLIRKGFLSRPAHSGGLSSQ